ncbi:MAG TPA: hypothetical protein VGN68_05150 [Sphingopyxis sp.]|jgi:hypothetical protein|uniref:hypothetical protein n=1 Tax=Sphingopyxis sp. TaxID=1908224 RepID=UPI002E119493|nr:hypothetical protein [Sphingopyxis sp.]
MIRFLSLIAVLAATLTTPHAAAAATGQKICTRHSTILLESGEKAEVNGAGASGVELLISGPAGQWIFADYNGLAAPGAGDVAVASTKTQTVVRRGQLPQIYVIYSKASRMIEGKQLTAFISGLYLDRRPFAKPRIIGSDADKAVWDRVQLGQTTSCDLRWVPGQGLMK